MYVYIYIYIYIMCSFCAGRTTSDLDLSARLGVDSNSSNNNDTSNNSNNNDNSNTSNNSNNSNYYYCDLAQDKGGPGAPGSASNA